MAEVGGAKAGGSTAGAGNARHGTGIKARGEVVVLRYGHRAVRDYRVTSHCCLVARAFGADKIIIAGEADPVIKERINAISAKWGGKFKVEFTESWKDTLRAHQKKGFYAVHTTMYGLGLQDEAEELRKAKKLLVIIGSQKVERVVYEMADLNVAVTSQPHSEIASLAVLLHEYFSGKELGFAFNGAKTRIVPDAHGKNIVNNTGRGKHEK
ncbi:MAG: tRNA (cytidine(56)-2'-O)-methyltransferase [Candidatus Diapherotrites archaeon]|nr:tRNA (cytidine(56)-2'-O)-methyltransferase [Candidatus Micrarchaeota archaeon]MBU1939205.1 tRNA (cytidine(56)-2'-O)-methyltransferase [Candidatus Micrarchaeota archaeon]